MVSSCQTPKSCSDGCCEYALSLINNAVEDAKRQSVAVSILLAHDYVEKAEDISNIFHAELYVRSAEWAELIEWINTDIGFWWSIRLPACVFTNRLKQTLKILDRNPDAGNLHNFQHFNLLFSVLESIDGTNSKEMRLLFVAIYKLSVNYVTANEIIERVVLLLPVSIKSKYLYMTALIPLISLNDFVVYHHYFLSALEHAIVHHELASVTLDLIKNFCKRFIEEAYSQIDNSVFPFFQRMISNESLCVRRRVRELWLRPMGKSPCFKIIFNRLEQQYTSDYQKLSFDQLIPPYWALLHSWTDSEQLLYGILAVATINCESKYSDYVFNACCEWGLFSRHQYICELAFLYFSKHFEESEQESKAETFKHFLMSQSATDDEHLLRSIVAFNEKYSIVSVDYIHNSWLKTVTNVFYLRKSFFDGLMKSSGRVAAMPLSVPNSDTYSVFELIKANDQILDKFNENYVRITEVIAKLSFEAPASANVVDKTKFAKELEISEVVNPLLRNCRQLSLTESDDQTNWLKAAIAIATVVLRAQNKKIVDHCSNYFEELFKNGSEHIKLQCFWNIFETISNFCTDSSSNVRNLSLFRILFAMLKHLNEQINDVFSKMLSFWEAATTDTLIIRVGKIINAFVKSSEFYIAPFYTDIIRVLLLHFIVPSYPIRSITSQIFIAICNSIFPQTPLMTPLLVLLPNHSDSFHAIANAYLNNSDCNILLLLSEFLRRIVVYADMHLPSDVLNKVTLLGAKFQSDAFTSHTELRNAVLVCIANFCPYDYRTSEYPWSKEIILKPCMHSLILSHVKILYDNKVHSPKTPQHPGPPYNLLNLENLDAAKNVFEHAMTSDSVQNREHAAYYFISLVQKDFKNMSFEVFATGASAFLIDEDDSVAMIAASISGTLPDNKTGRYHLLNPMAVFLRFLRSKCSFENVTNRDSVLRRCFCDLKTQRIAVNPVVDDVIVNFIRSLHICI